MRALRVILGVGGGIAAYKACILLRALTEAGHDLTVVPTAAALRFVGEPTWAALSGKPVQSGVFEGADRVPHVELGRVADLVVVAPATADLLARVAHGLADDLLTNVLLTARCPVLLAPAMHTEMWTHPATVANVALLRQRGIVVMEPDSGRLTGADSGPGRLPEPAAILDAALALAGPAQPAEPSPGPLAGRHVVISTGGTREPIDPVRFLGNRSSGKQGLAMARSALERGAQVSLVAANLDLPVPEGVRLTRVETAEQLGTAVLDLAPDADVVVMAAAVADFRPASYAEAKIKKTYRSMSAVAQARRDGAAATAAGPEDAPVIELVRTTDVLDELVRVRGGAPRPLVVGFAAETGDDQGSVLDHARAKLARKGCDVLVANRVGPGVTFGLDESSVQILTRDSDQVRQVGPASKAHIADAVWSVVQARLAHG